MGRVTEDIHESKVIIWKSVAIDRPTVPKWACVVKPAAVSSALLP
jgi:hypothetical protein